MCLYCLERQKILTTSNILKAKKNIRLVWQSINGIINMEKNSEESISSFLIDDQITSDKEISNHFNNFFTNFAEKINQNIVKSKKKKNCRP